VRGSARIYDVRMAQSVLKIERLSHIIGASPSPIMAPVNTYGVLNTAKTNYKKKSLEVTVVPLFSVKRTPSGKWKVAA